MMTRRSRKWSGPTIDRLEARQTPSLAAGAFVGVRPPVDVPIFIQPRLATTPADGSTFEAADVPSALVFSLGGPAAILWSDYSVELRQVAADGSEITMIGKNDWGPATFNANGTVALALPAKLDPGRYRIVLVGGGGLAFTYAQGRWDPTQDRSIAEFVVKPATGAIDLGVVGRDARTVAGGLDGQAADADAFRVHLADGAALWRLAVQVDAARIGSKLIAGLAVYDADGREVASVPVGANLPGDHPNDPYLFAGLAPGDYVVVLSRPAGMPGGEYRLGVVADPVVEPTRVASFALDRSDAGATGFTIAFSSPIDPARLRSDAVYVVDDSGAKHAVKLASVGAGLTSARFEFLGSLPAGDYRLVIAGDRPLADLIGRTPLADGLPGGTLAAWTITAAEAGPRVEPAPIGVVASGPLGLAPGSVLEVPIVLGADQSLVLDARLTSGAMRIELVGGPDGPVVLTDGMVSRGTELWIRPGAGAFAVRIVSVGGATLAGAWALKSAAVSDESLVAAAIGSRGAIGLRMAEGTGPSQSGPSAPDAPGGTTPRDSRAARSSTEAVGRATAAARSELGPSPWAYGAGPAPIGRPSTTADAVAPVGPSAPDGLSAVAWAGPDASARGASLILSTDRQADDGIPRGPAGSPEAAEATPVRDEEVARAATDAEADDGALDRAERVAESVLGGLRWLLDRPGRATPPAGDVDASALARAEAAAPGAAGSDGKVQRSALDLPFAVLFVTASTFHLRRATRRWWKKRKLAAGAAPQALPTAPRPLFRGPRLMTGVRADGRPSLPRRG